MLAGTQAGESEWRQRLVHDLGLEALSSTAVAVRQTPLTATESPSSSSSASPVRTVKRSSGRRAIGHRQSPKSATSPVNTLTTP